MDAVREKLLDLEKQYNEINEKLTDEEVVKNPKELTRLSKEEARLSQPVEALHKLQALDKRIEEAEELAKDDDAEMKEMAALELEECLPAREELLGYIQHLLIPRDPDDDHDVIMEIRGGVGGDEGNIFAGDLFRMYSKYAENMGWKVQVMEASPCEAGGFTQIIFSIKGTDVYKHLKFESGAHRVQRVPKTEAQGRIHTSTATVLAQPDIEIDPKDLTIETHRASGAGGQHINKTDSAVRIVHIPTGITVNCQEGRSQIENRETAMRLIRARVYEELKRRKEEAEGKIRREKIGTGDRSEKIRTYKLDRIMEGKLDDVVNGLLAEEEKRKLEDTE